MWCIVHLKSPLTSRLHAWSKNYMSKIVHESFFVFLSALIMQPSPQGLTWARVVFICVGGCVRGWSGVHPLVWAHAVLAQGRAGLSRLLVCQVQRGAFLGRRQWSSWPGGGVDLQPGLGFVFHNLPVVGTRHPALIQSFITLADSGDLQLVWDVVALDLHCLLW